MRYVLSNIHIFKFLTHRTGTSRQKNKLSFLYKILFII